MYRIDRLLKSANVLFHTQDLALLWGIKNRNTLYTLISRYLDKGILVSIHKGFYSTVPLDQIDPVRLGIGYLHTFAYLSCESVLAESGIIFQKSDNITLVSDRSTKFTVIKNAYLVRKLAKRYLFNPKGIVSVGGQYRAAIERAVADMLYFNRFFHFDNKKKIDWKKVREVQKEVYYL